MLHHVGAVGEHRAGHVEVLIDLDAASLLVGWQRGECRARNTSPAKRGHCFARQNWRDGNADQPLTADDNVCLRSQEVRVHSVSMIV